MKYVAFMSLDKSQFRELRYSELIDSVVKHQPYYVVEVDCPSIKEFEPIRVADNATITLQAEILGINRTDDGHLCARVRYRDHSTDIADANIKISFTHYHVLDESEIKVTKIRW